MAVEQTATVDLIEPRPQSCVLPTRATTPIFQPHSRERVRVDGKFFAAGDQRFEFRGVTYGTFAPRDDGAQFPEHRRVVEDFTQMRDAGFTVVRTYTLPPEDVLAAAGEQGLRILAGIFYPDWRYLLGESHRAVRRVARAARAEVRTAARQLAGDPRVLGLALGNEIPADVLRWHGTNTIARAIADLATTVRDEDPGQLVTYANYPTAEYLPLETLDFLTFNVFLEREDDLRRYLTRLHHLAGDRPLVLGEFGSDAGHDGESEKQSAWVLGEQLDTALERGVAGTCVFSWTDEWWVGGNPVEGWSFGLTRADRSARPALYVARSHNERTIRDHHREWPSMSVVVCAHNAEATLDECLRHTCALDYPELEIIVVDDGSTDATAEIARRHARVRLVQIEHAGLSCARNEGLRVAAGQLIAYLDSDAYPAPEWPYYLVLGLDDPRVGGVGGPNLPPPGDGPGAHVVARAPGGPVHVLLADDRAEHVPGCNMAFWKSVLVGLGGFDPIYTSAGDDVDICWKALDRGWNIGFHPAAVVWHHRRPGLRTYLRQQRGYGRSEALVEARHPDRFTSAGTARWRGRIYASVATPRSRQRVYHGAYGAAAYQSVYHAHGDALDLVHQLGLPFAALLALTAPLGLVAPWLALPAAMALLLAVVVGAIDMVRTQPPRTHGGSGLAFRAHVATHHLLQPVARIWGRVTSRQSAHASLAVPGILPPLLRRAPGGVVVVADERPRAELASALLAELRRRGLRASSPNGWEKHDARVVLSPLVCGDLVTSSHPVGYVQIRVRPHLRVVPLVALATAAAVAAIVSAPLANLVLIAIAGALAFGEVRARLLLRRVLEKAVPA